MDSSDDLKIRNFFQALEEVYVLYMNNDTIGLLSDDFDYMIDDMEEQGKIVENLSDIEYKKGTHTNED